jgi:hypothetical protein
MIMNLKAMTAALEANAALETILRERCIRGNGREYLPKSVHDAFLLLDQIISSGFSLYSPLELAKTAGTSKQNINNMLSRGHLIVLTWDQGTADYRYIVATADRPAEAIDDSGWLQTVLPEPKAEATEILAATTAAAEIVAEAHETAKGLGLVEKKYNLLACRVCFAARQGCTDCCAKCTGKCNSGQACSQGKDPVQLAIRARAFDIDCLHGAMDGLSPIDSLLVRGFSRDEAKILMTGYDLVRYDREAKTVWLAETQYTIEDGRDNWVIDPERDEARWYKTGKSPYPTFASAERAVKEILDDGATIEIGGDGKVVHCNNRDLLDAGFDFYRTEGIIPGHGIAPRIKSFTKGWGTVQKFDTPAECQKAWDELMLTDKALQG